MKATTATMERHDQQLRKQQQQRNGEAIRCTTAWSTATINLTIDGHWQRHQLMVAILDGRAVKKDAWLPLSNVG